MLWLAWLLFHLHDRYLGSDLLLLTVCPTWLSIIAQTLLSRTRESCSPNSQSLALLFKSKAYKSVDSDSFWAHVQDMCHIGSTFFSWLIIVLKQLLQDECIVFLVFCEDIHIAYFNCFLSSVKKHCARHCLRHLHDAAGRRAQIADSSISNFQQDCLLDTNSVAVETVTPATFWSSFCL